MKTPRNLNFKLSVVSLTIVFGAAIFWFNPANELKTTVKVLPPPQGLEYMHFGFRDSAADILWLDFIQHAFDCSKYKDPKGVHCPYRWGYQTLKTASLLAPKFGALYESGAVNLTVILDDHVGAAELFEKGAEQIPSSWIIPYRAAYLYLEEIKDYEKAGLLLEKAAVLGAPFWTRSLASRMYDKSGQLELSYRVLEDLHRETPNGPWKSDLELRMAKIAERLRLSGAF